MNDKVYVVFGSTGEYSDRSEWPVCAFSDRASAELFAVRANRWAKAFEVLSDGMTYSQVSALETSCPFDPHFHMDYTGTDYTYAEVAIRSDVPEEQTPAPKADPQTRAEKP